MSETSRFWNAWENSKCPWFSPGTLAVNKNLTREKSKRELTFTVFCCSLKFRVGGRRKKEKKTRLKCMEKEMATHSSIPAWRVYGQRSLAGPWGHKSRTRLSDSTKPKTSLLPSQNFSLGSCTKMWNSSVTTEIAFKLGRWNKSRSPKVTKLFLSMFTEKIRASLVVQRLKRLPAMWETWVRNILLNKKN